MARRYILVDDLDNREGTDENPVETVLFGFRGKSYEIDLSSKNGAAFDKVMSRYLQAAKEFAPERPAVVKARGRRSAASASTGSDAAEIRAWASTKPDIKLSPRGRVPAPVRERFYRETAGIPDSAPGPAADGSHRQPEPATSAG